jgi:hypothetical protein
MELDLGEEEDDKEPVTRPKVPKGGPISLRSFNKHSIGGHVEDKEEVEEEAHNAQSEDEGDEYPAFATKRRSGAAGHATRRSKRLGGSRMTEE